MRLFVISILIGSTLIATAQSKKRKSDKNSLEGVPFKERLVTGGGLGLGFGSQVDYFSISPLVGYKITEKLVAGTSLTYRYTKYKYYTPALKLIDYGVGPFVRYSIFKNIFVQTEFEYLNYEFPTTPTESIRESYTSFLAGGGFFQPVGNKAVFFLTALYNFSYEEPLPGVYSPYYSPLILRAGISFGF